MNHAIGYFGPFDENFHRLQPGFTHYVKRDGVEMPVNRRPENVDGIYFGQMERRKSQVSPDREFYCVCAEYNRSSVYLYREVRLNPTEYTKKHFGPKPVLIDDKQAYALLMALINNNSDQSAELDALGRRCGLF